MVLGCKSGNIIPNAPKEVELYILQANSAGEAFPIRATAAYMAFSEL